MAESEIVLAVNDLGKRYVLGGLDQLSNSFREMIIDLFSAPFKRYKKLSGTAADAELFWALKNINFSVERGEVIGVIGKNGAGKSTLLKILSRITTPTEGSVTIKGNVASLLEVGTGFHPELTGRENIFLNGAILGMKRKEIAGKFDDIIEFAGIEKFVDTPVKRYSSGMYVRLAFSIAAHLDPDILIVDEVLAVGDVKFQKKCLGKLKDVATTGRTVLFVSHNMEAVQNLCSKCILLEAGTVKRIGPTKELIADYMSDLVEIDPYDSYVRRQTVHDKMSSKGARIASIQLYDADNNSVTEFNIWETLRIRFEIENQEQVDESVRLALWFCFTNQMGSVVESFFQYDANNGHKEFVGNQVIDAEISALSLPPGYQTISCGILELNDLGKRDVVDWAENLITIKVKNRFEDGRVFDQRIGNRLSRCKWSLH